MNPLKETEPENMEMVKEKKIRDEPLPDDIYNENRKGGMKC